MENKNGLYVASALVLGIGIGAVVGYSMAKKTMEANRQEELDEVANYYKKKYAEKKEEKNDEKEKAEENIVKNDKPSISEMSSIVAGYNTTSSDRTNYNHTNNTVFNAEEIKKAIKKFDEKFNAEPKEKAILIKDYAGYMALEGLDDFDEEIFRYCTDTEQWVDWNGVEYDSDELPFNVDDIKWFDEDQCYIIDKEEKAVYVVEKVEKV